MDRKLFLSLLLLQFSRFSFAAGPLSIQVIAGDEQFGSFANSVIITGEHEALLVDTQRTVDNAKKVVAVIRKSGKDLSTVFITHGHPDHMLGAKVIQEAFPKAKFYASASVASEIKIKGESIRQFVTKNLQESGITGQVPQAVVVPEELKQSFIKFEDFQFPVIETKSTESDTAAFILVKPLKALIAGDLVYNKVHLFLAENHFSGWIEELQKIKTNKDVEHIYPGHGEVSDISVLDRDIEYIQNFERVVKEEKTISSAVSQMKKLYPNYRMERFMSYSISKYYEAKK